MWGRARASACAAALALAGVGCGADDAAAPPQDREAARGQAAGALRLRTVVSGLDRPLHLAAPRSEPTRLYVVEMAGRVRVVVGGRLRAEPFLDIRDLVSSGGERGLLSIAFHPRYGQNRRFYVNYTDARGDTRVVEYRSDGTRALPGSRRELLHVPQPYSNHNGGQLAFGPDGRLWIGTGDGGSAGDPLNVAQNMRSLLGKLLTLAVDRDNPRPRIAGLGLRNPWRFSFDRRTGDLYLGDVGQNRWEEVDYLPRRRLGRLQNYGWDVYEGRAVYERKPRNRAGVLVRPVRVYSLSGGHCAVSGGFVYRGSSLPRTRGRYFYGDTCSGSVWSFRMVRGKVRQHRRERFSVPRIVSFGEDARGELYLVSLSGSVYRLSR
ncbi:MAG: PQQ-dependent sugar dehydrogenase [Thermoleophilia bacterium]|nr:PQQ-dependent sugar dehydrogenase [Thermoleophilia bacterium]